jgi:hypothetical protein
MSAEDLGSRTGPWTDAEEESTTGGGAARAREPRDQDSAGAGRGVGLGITTVVGLVLLGVPAIWAVAYVTQAGAAGLGNAVTILFVIVMLAVMGAGAVLIRGLFRS